MPKKSSSKTSKPGLQDPNVASWDMSKKTSSKPTKPVSQKPSLAKEKPSSAPKRYGQEIDEIFSMKRKKPEQQKTNKLNKKMCEDSKDDESVTRKKKKSKSGGSNVDMFENEQAARPRRKTADGLTIYTEEELGFGKADAGDMTDKKARVSWKLECVDKAFLEACIHELTTNGREGSSLKESSWKVVAEKLKNDHNFIVDHKQMKNRYGYLKAKYAVWLKLKNKTGNLYDPITNTFNMSDEEWDAEAKLNTFVDKLRNAPLPCPDLCTKLFDGVTSIGVHAWGPSSTLPHPAEECLGCEIDDVQCTQTETLASIEPPSASEESTGRSKHKAGIQNSKEDSRNTLDEYLIEVSNEIINVAKMLVEKNNIDNDMDACMKKLEKMEWGEEDPRYITTLLLFGESADIRKVWLHLKPMSCESWVRNAGRKFGLLG